ncbi:hypothetical protein KMW28_17015 [Flammeovirga yaeyamensis]|uniref:Phage shock protein B n=1 Tax=Flammeovirga yaeyamensis TaxID=367791 RepID=A0AAX1N1B8_9BACT|nr:hypothetical protein [Flammeovirga yaeyamensis]MBB3698282.1 regulator of replication initiation timing [Flammeovirga yaeyamensis]NMF34364.1 hypothetical protein [Flammeovirga yaeyamensis]QWG01345.1 hypothetical protein KMW28_17015 [Flammeovirga yaeyamensis]
MDFAILIPLMALSIPIVAILANSKGKLKKKDYQRLLEELENLKIENKQLKDRVENIETIVTEPDWDIKRTLGEGDSTSTPRLEE